MTMLRATKDDLNTLVDISFDDGYLWNKLSFDQTQSLIHDAMLNSSEEFFIYCEDDVFKGFISLLINDTSGDVGFLSVKKDFQGHGISKKLIDYVISLAKKRSLCKLTLAVWENNFILETYKKFGFKVISKKENFYANGDSKLYLELVL